MNLDRRSEGLAAKKRGRARDVQLHLWVTEEEAALIRDRMARMGVTGLSAYMRKMAIDGYFINLDLAAVKELVSLLRYCSNNLNQYAKKANESGSVYAADVEDLRLRFEEIWDAASGILRELAGIQ
jgi:hypothetical protein